MLNILLGQQQKHNYKRGVTKLPIKGKKKRINKSMHFPETNQNNKKITFVISYLLDLILLAYELISKKKDEEFITSPKNLIIHFDCTISLITKKRFRLQHLSLYQTQNLDLQDSVQMLRPWYIKYLMQVNT